jgi:hypothetical protein
MFMFACRASSRKELDRISDNVAFCDNLCRFSGAQNDTVMVSEQIINVLKKLDADETIRMTRREREKEKPSRKAKSRNSSI